MDGEIDVILEAADATLERAMGVEEQDAYRLVAAYHEGGVVRLNERPALDRLGPAGRDLSYEEALAFWNFRRRLGEIEKHPGSQTPNPQPARLDGP